MADVAIGALTRITEVQPETLAIIERCGFVFATPLSKPDDERTEAERWETLAFSLYTTVCEIDGIARSALAQYEERA